MSVKGIIGFIFLFSELLIGIIGLVGIVLADDKKESEKKDEREKYD